MKFIWNRDSLDKGKPASGIKIQTARNDEAGNLQIAVLARIDRRASGEFLCLNGFKFLTNSLHNNIGGLLSIVG